MLLDAVESCHHPHSTNFINCIFYEIGTSRRLYSRNTGGMPLCIWSQKAGAYCTFVNHQMGCSYVCANNGCKNSAGVFSDTATIGCQSISPIVILVNVSHGHFMTFIHSPLFAQTLEDHTAKSNVHMLLRLQSFGLNCSSRWYRNAPTKHIRSISPRWPFHQILQHSAPKASPRCSTCFVLLFCSGNQMLAARAHCNSFTFMMSKRGIGLGFSACFLWNES